MFHRGLLNLYRITGSMQSYLLHKQLLCCVGSCFVGLHEFDTQKNHEVNEFRTKMRSFCEEKAQERQRLPWHQWMEYNFPCDLEPISVVAQTEKSHLSLKKIFINVKFEASEVSRCDLCVWTPLVCFTSHPL